MADWYTFVYMYILASLHNIKQDVKVWSPWFYL